MFLEDTDKKKVCLIVNLSLLDTQKDKCEKQEAKKTW